MFFYYQTFYVIIIIIAEINHVLYLFFAACVIRTESEKKELFLAGLGGKDISFADLNKTPSEFHEKCLECFPRLKDGGGFRFLKGIPNSRNMELLSTSVNMSPLRLKEHVANSHTYIRPVQPDLDFTPLDDNGDNMPAETCLNCGKVFPLNDLEKHADSCKGEEKKMKVEEYGGDVKIDLTLDDA